MALFHVFSEVENRYTGVPMAGVQVRARFAGVSSVAPIYADPQGTPFVPANYCVSDNDGMYSFYVDSGTYDLDFLYGDQVVKTIKDYRPAEVGPTGPANSTYTNTSELENSDVANVSAILSEAGKAGTFTIRNYADFSAQVAADPGKVNYIRSVSDPSQVWVRTTILSVGAAQTGASSGLTVDGELAAKATLTGVARTATNLGNFTGTTIPAGSAIKPALQSLVTAVENTTGNAATKTNASAVGVAPTAADMGTYASALVSDGQSAKQNIVDLAAAAEARVPSADLASTATGKGAGLSGFNPTSSYPENSAGKWISWLGEDRDIRWYGYRADGQNHPLSSVDFFKGRSVTGWTLAQWQAEVPEVAALNEEIDRVAIQAWFNDRPKGGSITLPFGEAVFDRGIRTGSDQQVEIIGAGREGTRIRHTGADWLWEHGWSKGEANSSFTVKSLTIIPAAGQGAAGCFRVRFSGSQRPWCHNIADVLIYPEDGNSYYIQPTETWNIKRGLDWENFIVYGRHFYLQPTDAHLFPPNVGPDCPAGQAQKISGNSYNFDNCMVIGYHDGWRFDFTGFVGAEHCHEEGRWYGCEAYAGVGFASIVNQNPNYAPADNWVFEHCGWQGTGRAFDLEGLEFFRCTGMLMVNDTTNVANHVWLANIIDCRDVQIEGNEIFIVSGSSNLTAFYIAGPGTAGVEINNNATVSYSNINQWMYVGTDAPAGSVEERANRFRGTGLYSGGKINDASGSAVSETRVSDILAAAPPANIVAGSVSAHVTAAGDIVYEAVYRKPTADGFGNVTAFFPAGLFRSVKGAPEVCNANASDTTIPFVSNAGNTGGVTVRCVTNGTSPPTGTNVSFRIRQVGG